MKKLVYVLAAATVLLQACSTGNTFSKKHYGHLKWIDHDTQVEVPGKETAESKEQVPTHKKQVNSPAPTIDQKQEEVVTPSQKTEKTKSDIKPFIAPVSKQEIEQRATVETKESENAAVKNVSEQNNVIPVNTQQEKIGSPRPMMDDTAKLIICVILCLLIPPLAMYLWDQQTDVWFIVDLILFLFCIFLFLGYSFGLLFLTAIVIALLRVFEAI